jgi:hypothetical protein
MMQFIFPEDYPFDLYFNGLVHNMVYVCISGVNYHNHQSEG